VTKSSPGKRNTEKSRRRRSGVDSHDPEDWVVVTGRFDRQRWGDSWRRLFTTHKLIHNHRYIRRILLSAEGDGAFAVVDIDTLWRANNGETSHWNGRVCKVGELRSSELDGEWKMTMHTGVLGYPIASSSVSPKPTN
jgi:hypothetical protein